MEKLEKIIKLSFYLFVFFLPWNTRLIWHDASINGYIWEYGRYSLYGTEILLWLTLILYLFWLLKTKQLQKFSFSGFISKLKKPEVLIYWLIILFVFICGLSVFWALDASLAYNRWFTLLEAVAMCSMILVFDFKLEKIAICLVASGAVQGIFASWQFFSQYVFANKWLGLAEHLSTVSGSVIVQTVGERWLRAYGSFPHPNILGGFLAISLLFLLYLAFLAKTKKQRIFVLFSLLAITPGLFFTFSRGAWVALIFSFGVLGAWLWQKKYYLWNKTFLKILSLIFLMVLILGVNLHNPLIARFRGQENTEVESIQLRVAFANQSWQLIKDLPLMGEGIGNYTLGIYQKINSTWPGYYYQPVHNIYLLVPAEVGIFGAAIFYLILLLLIIFLIKSVLTLEKVILLLTLFSILVMSLFDHYFWTLYCGVIIFWLVLGLNLKQLDLNKLK